mmetsp:Transcript_10828/g.22084  ORF Transcript_10828/g.22084 Transcript_10828/m.22084 type:complete len:529 (+) Transcript_10828:448-2034(+)
MQNVNYYPESNKTLEQDETFPNYYDEIFLNPLPFDLPPSPPPTTSTPQNTDQMPYYYYDNISISQSHQGTVATAQIATESNMSSDASFLVTPIRSNKSSMSCIRTPNFSLPILSTLATKPLKHPKKSVHFQSFVRVVQISIPPASDMTLEEKQDIWYNHVDFDRFKWKSAQDAGVQLFRFQHAKANEDMKQQPCQFLLDGNFDDTALNNHKRHDDAKRGSVNEAITAAKETNLRGVVSSKVNEKEYDDDETHQICKRGLGYHFSRVRRRHKLMFRSTILEWQRKLREHSNESSPNATASPYSVPSFSGIDHGASLCADNNETAKPDSDLKQPSQPLLKRVQQKSRYPPLDRKSQLILALVSKKFARDACGSAEWRGRVDYKVAYPERHSMETVASKKSKDAYGGSNSVRTNRTDAEAVRADWVQSCPTAATNDSTTATNFRKQNRRCAAVFHKRRSIGSAYAFSSNLMNIAGHQPASEQVPQCEDDNCFNANKRQRRNHERNNSDAKSGVQSPSSLNYFLHVLESKKL